MSGFRVVGVWVSTVCGASRLPHLCFRPSRRSEDFARSYIGRSSSLWCCPRLHCPLFSCPQTSDRRHGEPHPLSLWAVCLCVSSYRQPPEGITLPIVAALNSSVSPALPRIITTHSARRDTQPRLKGKGNHHSMWHTVSDQWVSPCRVRFSRCIRPETHDRGRRFQHFRSDIAQTRPFRRGAFAVSYPLPRSARPRGDRSPLWVLEGLPPRAYSVASASIARRRYSRPVVCSVRFPRCIAGR